MDVELDAGAEGAQFATGRGDGRLRKGAGVQYGNDAPPPRLSRTTASRTASQKAGQSEAG